MGAFTPDSVDPSVSGVLAWVLAVAELKQRTLRLT
jgi:hypothetical protein